MSNEQDALIALSRYIDTLRSMPNEAGAAVRAIDHAAMASLPPLEQYLAGDLVQSAATGETEREWTLRHVVRDSGLPLPDTSHDDAPNRVAQAIANLMDAGLWPW